MNPEIKKRKYVILAFIIGVILLTAPHMIRINDGNTTLIGDLSYYNLNIAKNIDGIFYQDNSYNNSLQIINPQHLLLNLGGANEIFSRLIPLVLGLMSILMVFLIFERLNLKAVLRDVFLFMFIFSPVFIFTFSLSSKYSLSVFLFLAGFNFFIGKRKWELIVSTIIFSIMPFFGIFESIIAISSLLTFTLINKNKKNWFFITLIFITISTAIHTYIVQKYLLESIKPYFIKISLLRDIISDFGKNIGFGIFKIVLSFIGLTTLWKEKEKNTWSLLLIITIISLMFIDSSLIIYAGFFLIYFASLGFVYLIEMKWDAEYLKYLTLITIASGILFSTVAYIDVVSNNSPTNELIDTYKLIEEKIPEGKFISHYSNGYLIQSILKKDVFMNSNFKHNPNVNKYYNISEEIFYSRNLENTLTLLKENNITYILIDKEMRDGQVWERNEEGLLFLLKNDKTFIKTHYDSEIEVYKVEYEEIESN